MDQLDTLRTEYRRLKEENVALRRLLAENGIALPARPQTALSAQGKLHEQDDVVNEHSRKDAKIALFRSLFRGRDDVYAVRTRFRSGEWGYMPASIRDWKAVLLARTAFRCMRACRTRLARRPVSAARTPRPVIVRR